MSLQAYKGYFENGHFYAAGQTLHIPERQQVILTILEESISDNEPATNKDIRAKWLENLNTAIQLSSGEQLPDITRSSLLREPTGLTD